MPPPETSFGTVSVLPVFFGLSDTGPNPLLFLHSKEIEHTRWTTSNVTVQARIQVFELEGAKFGEGSGDRQGPQSGSGQSPGGGTRWAKPLRSSCNLAISGPKNHAFSYQNYLPQSLL